MSVCFSDCCSLHHLCLCVSGIAVVFTICVCVSGIADVFTICVCVFQGLLVSSPFVFVCLRDCCSLHHLCLCVSGIADVFTICVCVFQGLLVSSPSSPALSSVLQSSTSLAATSPASSQYLLLLPSHRTTVSDLQIHLRKNLTLKYVTDSVVIGVHQSDRQ